MKWPDTQGVLHRERTGTLYTYPEAAPGSWPGSSPPKPRINDRRGRGATSSRFPAFDTRGRSDTAVTIYLPNSLRVEAAANADVTWRGELLTLLRKPEHAR